VQNNLFVKGLHEGQVEYEKRIIEKGEDISFFSYSPFVLNFPDYITIKFESSNDSRIDKIILTRKDVGKITIEFHDRGRSNYPQRAFFMTTMRPGNRYHQFEEINFEISTDIYIKKYAYFPLIGVEKKKQMSFSHGLMGLLNC
jgi:hypothetical protein